MNYSDLFPTGGGSDKTLYVDKFTSSGTWVKPAGVNWVEVILVGGGGGGSSLTTEYSGGGGGAVIHDIVPVTGNVTVTIGAGGAKGVDGGDSTFGSLLTAKGGSRGSSYGGVGGVNAGNGAYRTNNVYFIAQSGSGVARGKAPIGTSAGGGSWGDSESTTNAAPNTGGGGARLSSGGSGYCEVRYWL